MEEKVHDQTQPEDANARLADQIKELNRLLELEIATRSWKVALRNGLFAGLGTVIGATILVSILIASLRLASPVWGVGPTLERIAESLEAK